MFDFFHACRTTQTHFLLRAAQNRRTQSDAQEVGYVLDQARAWPSQESHSFEVPASHGRQARTTQLHISFGAMTLLPPRNEPRANKQPFSLWVIRLWEEESPPGVEPLEWILLSSLPIHTLAQAWERANWYAHRWVVEDDHQCLKIGCRIEQRQRQTVERFFRLLGLLSPVAVRLLQLRDIARSSPDRPACEVVEADLLPVVAAQADLDPSVMTTEVFWREVARLGGYLPRRRDGPPGWKTLWAGWLRVQTLLEGFHLASHLLSCVV